MFVNKKYVMKTRGRGYLKVFRRPYTENKAKRQEPEPGRAQHTRKQGRRQTRSTSNPERATKKGRTPEEHQEPTQTTKARFPQIGFWVVARFSFGTECSFAPSFEDGVEYFLRPLGFFCWASCGAHVENVWSPLVQLNLFWGAGGARLGSSCELVWAPAVRDPASGVSIPASSGALLENVLKTTPPSPRETLTCNISMLLHVAK